MRSRFTTTELSYADQLKGESMDINQEIKDYIASLPAAKSAELQTLHELALQASPGCRVWYTDGRNEEGKVVANPNIGYGQYTIRYADGKTREFYEVGLSANTTGISVYIMGLEDKKFLANTYGSTIGKASVTGYCIKFKSLKDIDLSVLEAAMRHGFGAKRKES